MELLRVLLVFAIVVVTMASRLPRSTERFTDDFQVCRTKNGKQGYCVNERYCNEDHTIEPGGLIHESELRSYRISDVCIQGLEWCCTLDRISQMLLTRKES
ncbi:unnamed protein product [Euphydryas editha]|uniref:Plethodontid modulating factor n=1 Tax=Euphydryas editha TaxID=104508 RepID=A0AAU9UJ67_EUPED|nr:unnamed protein product [Euphydryas editha]